MFDFKNVKQKRLVITGIIFSIVLIVGIAIFFLFKNTTPPKTTTAKEVYFQSFKEGMMLDFAGQFQSVKKLIFPDNPNITLATMQQIKEAVSKGLKICNGGLGLDDNGKEVMITVRPGPPNITVLAPLCTQTQSFDIIPNFVNIKSIWVFGIKPKPPNNTEGIARFSILKWSQFYP